MYFVYLNEFRRDGALSAPLPEAIGEYIFRTAVSIENIIYIPRRTDISDMDIVTAQEALVSPIKQTGELLGPIEASIVPNTYDLILTLQFLE